MNLRHILPPAACLAACLFSSHPGHAQNAPPSDSTAITAAIEEEKNAYLALDEARIATCWIQSSSSLKVYFVDGKEERVDGFDAIRAHDRANLARERTLPPGNRSRFTFTGYRVTQQGDSAWVTCRATWAGYSGGTAASGNQTRIYVLRWSEGRWRIALMAIIVLAPDEAVPVSTPSSMHLDAVN